MYNLINKNGDMIDLFLKIEAEMTIELQSILDSCEKIDDFSQFCIEHCQNAQSIFDDLVAIPLTRLERLERLEISNFKR